MDLTKNILKRVTPLAIGPHAKRADRKLKKKPLGCVM